MILTVGLIFCINYTDKQVSRLPKAFGNNSSANRKFSKTELYEMAQLGGFLPFCLSFFSKSRKYIKK